MVRYISSDDDSSSELTLHEPKATGYLVLLSNGRVSHSFPLRGEVQLGRDKKNGIVVSDQKVSRLHATLIETDNTYTLRDEGSANGTYLNGVLIKQPSRLKDKDRIGIGDTDFLFTNSIEDPRAIDQPAFFKSKPILPQQSAASFSLSTDNKTTWAVLGCMGITIIGLLIALATLLGMFVGRSQVGGWLLFYIASFL
ncbi:MAG: FHA domain-containing protein [Anaerolineae bacterium]|nr:FHA domain-containing protein [Anaerolineae bacterium]